MKKTNAQIRTALLAAARQIEQNPETFDFMQVDVPDHCGMPGCALGWISYFLGLRRNFSACLEHLGLSDHGQFYRRLDCLYQGSFPDRYDWLKAARWRINAEACAKALRLYADQYYPAARKQEPPDWNAIATRRDAIDAKLEAIRAATDTMTQRNKRMAQ